MTDEMVDGVSSDPVIGQSDASISEGVSSQGQASTNAVPEEGQTAEAPKPEDTFDYKQGYKNLETKLGDWKAVEERAGKYDSLAPVLEKLQGKDALSLLNAQADLKAQPNFDDMSAEEIVRHLATDIAKKEVGELKKTFETVAEDFYTHKASLAIDRVRDKFPDFDEHREQVKEYLDAHPKLVSDEATLEDVYKIVSFDNASQNGADDAYQKQREKSAISSGTLSSAPSNVRKPIGTIEQAYQAAIDS